MSEVMECDGACQCDWPCVRPSGHDGVHWCVPDPEPQEVKP